jgi:hypothetical protein
MVTRNVGIINNFVGFYWCFILLIIMGFGSVQSQLSGRYFFFNFIAFVLTLHEKKTEMKT